MNYKGIIFDLDGVICYTDQYHYQAWSQIAAELGVPFDKTVNNRLRGVSRGESFEIILEGYPGKMEEEEKKKFLQKKNVLYQKLLLNLTPADLGSDVKEALEALRNMGLKLAIGSSSKNTPLILERLGLNGFFDAVADGNCITRTKPDPQVFQIAGEFLGLEPETLLVVEDAAAGVKAAHAAGMRCAAIGLAALTAGADYQINSLAELPALCNSKGKGCMI